MKLSVVIPCYNCEKTVVETLDSVVNQSYHDYEIILVNDGSVDSTQKIIEEYIENNKKTNIKLINQKNSGVSSARNLGIEESCGEYLLLLDSDDLFAPGYFESVAHIISEYNSDVVSGYRTTKREKIAIITKRKDRRHSIDPKYLLRKYTISKKELGISSFVFKRNLLDEYNIRFTVNSKYGEDWEFITKYLCHCKTAMILDEYCFYNRILSTSASRTISWNQVDAIFSAERTYHYLQQHSYVDAKWFYDYMYPRTIFSVSHRFAKGNNKEMFNNLSTLVDVKANMKMLAKNKDADKKSRLAALLYLISPKIYFFVAKNI